MTRGKRFLYLMNRRIRINNLPLILSMEIILIRKIFMKIVPMDWSKVFFKVIMELYLPMDRQELEKLLLWREEKKKIHGE